MFVEKCGCRFHYGIGWREDDRSDTTTVPAPSFDEGNFAIVMLISKTRRPVLILWSIAALYAHASVAKNEPSHALTTADHLYTADRLRRMPYDELARVADDFTALSGKIRDMMARSTATDLRYDYISDVARYHTLEAQSLLMRLVRSEVARVDRAEGIGGDPRLIEDALDALASFGGFGRSRPTDLAREFDDLIEEANHRHQRHPFVIGLDQRLRDTKARIDARLERLPELQALIDEKMAHGAGGARGALERTRELLGRYVIGQEHIVDRIMAQLWGNKARGAARARGGTFFVMGMDGTGHGEIARALVKSIHAFPTAELEHLMPVPIMQDHDDLWSAMGSATGYYGSESGVPEILAWLVKHSGGKYAINTEASEKGEKFRVVRNLSWRPGDRLEGYYRPEEGVLFFDNLQNWSKTMKDKFLLPALSKRRFKINNPNGGETYVDVPVHIYCATNEGAGLLVPRDLNGQRQGPPLDYARLIEKFDRVHDDPGVLKGALLESNGLRNAVAHRTARGISEELVGKIPDSAMMLTRPFSPAERAAIARRHLESLAIEMYAGGSDLMGSTTLTWTDAVTELVASHGTIDEDNALGIKDRLENLVRDPISTLIQTDLLKPGLVSTDLELDVHLNDDGTRNLVARVRADHAAPVEIETLMKPTVKDRARPLVSDERIDQLVAAGPHLKTRVFGIDPIIERLTERALSIANAAASGKPQPATVLMMDGLSSTGKTQLTLEFAETILGSRDELLTIDFSRVQSLRAMEEEITGFRDEHGNAVKSRFMKAYDRGNGEVVVALDELANVADPRLLKVLYDLLRVDVMHTFSDNVPRPMTRVVLLITGNATQNIYLAIPSDLPMDVQMLAWEEMHENISRDFGTLRAELAKTYPDAMLNRVQRGNTFVMPPFNWKTLRQLAQQKLGAALDQMRDLQGRRGWSVHFASLAEYQKFVDTIIDEGFELREQGASVEKFIANDVRERLEAMLLREKVAPGAEIVLREVERTANDDEAEAGVVRYELAVSDRTESLRFEIPRRFTPKALELDDHVLRKTGYHEAGHAIVTRVAFPEAYVPTTLSVKPGLTKIANEWLYYAGIAQDTQRLEMSITRDWIVRQIAVLLAGETAERLVTRGQVHASGKANDIERAAALAQNAILRFGLSARWGVDAIPSGESIGTYIANLPERDKLILRTETHRLVREGRRMAERILIANFDNGLVPLANEVVSRTKLQRAHLIKFYDEHHLIDPDQRGLSRRATDWAQATWRKYRYRARRTLNPEIIDVLPKPAAVGNIKALALSRKRELYAEVPPPANVPISAWPEKMRERPPKLLLPPKDCAGLLAPAA